MKTKYFALSLLLTSSLICPYISHAAPILTRDNMPANERIAISNAWLEIDEAAYIKNLYKVKSKLGANTKICAIVKADAYGTGLDLLIPTLIKAQVPCLGFASNEEARIARQHNYKGMLIRVRTGSITEARNATQYDVVEIVGNLEHAKKLAEQGKNLGKDIKVHLAINAGGLSRNGIELTTKQGKRQALEIAQLKHIKITGLMTHFPVEDIADIKKDLILFNQQSDWFIKAAKLNRKDITIHTSNSFTTLNVPEAQFDMVRIGGGLIGDIESELNPENIMSFKTTVVSVNNYPKGNTVGYDRTFTLQRNSRLANLPIGYADGYRRVFSNKGMVLINGHKVPVVGKISMNTTMVDVTDFPDIKEGDEVVLFGKQKGAEITQEEIETLNGALLSDLATVWGNSNPKILIKANSIPKGLINTSK